MARPINANHHRAQRLRIMDAGLTVFSRRGYAGASTAAVCREAGISSGAFFHYFPTKASLLIAILEQSSHETREFFDERENPADPVAGTREDGDHEPSSLEDAGAERGRRGASAMGGATDP